MDYISKYGEVREKILLRHFAINKFFRTNYVSDIAPYPEQRYENPLIYTGHLMVCLAIEHQLGNPEALKILRSTLESISTLYKFKGNHFDGYIVRYDAVHSNIWKTEPKPDGFFKRDYCENFIRDGAGSYLYVTPLDYYQNLIEKGISSGVKDPKYVFYDYNVLYRYWEPSIDELVGLMMGYDVVFRLVNDPEIQNLVKTQANQLGDYLAEYNYMLVRPSSGFIQKNGANPADIYPNGMGNFTLRGSMGINPALEYPFGFMFKRITGNAYHSRSSPDKAWEDTVKKAEAGIWDNIDISDEAVGKLIVEKTAEGILTVSIGGILGSILDAVTGLPVAEFLLGTATASVVGLVTSILIPTLEVLGLRENFLVLFNNGDLLRAYIIFRDCEDNFSIKDNFDCKDKFGIINQGEVAAAYLLSKLEPAKRFKIYMEGAAMQIGGHANFFPRHLAMSCAPISNHQTDPFVSYQYDMWLDLYKPKYNSNEKDELLKRRAYAEDTFVKAVGVLLNKGEGWEVELVTMLDQCYNDCIKPVTEIDPHVALDYMSAIALAWMHVKIGANQGKPIGTPRFTLPVFSNNSPGWPVPGFSKQEIIDVLPPKGGEPSPTSTIIPFNSIQSNRNFWNLKYINGKAPLFLDPFPLKPVEPDGYSPSWPACAFNNPPYIKEVAVVQTSTEQEPDGFAEFKSNLPCECGTIKYYAYWKENSEKTRYLIVTENRTLDFRKVAYIFIKSSEVLRPESVKVTLIGQTKSSDQLFQLPVSMRSEHSERDGEYYFGSFSPSNRWSQNYIIKLEIRADSTEQYGLRDPEGKEIDSDPRSIARVDKNKPPLFPYVDYEPGTDCNHQIEMGMFIQSLPPDELEKNNDFQSAKYVSLVSDKDDSDPKTIFEDSGKVYGDEKVFSNLKLSDVNDQDYFSIEYSCPKSDDEDNSMKESTTTSNNKYFSTHLTHRPPCLSFSVHNAENYCVDMEIYQCNELNKKIYKRLLKTNHLDMLSPTSVLGARKCYLVIKNTDYISQGAFSYDITISYTSSYVEINYKSNGFALSTVARQLLRRYYELIDLPRPTEDFNVARSVINVGEFIKRYEKFLEDPVVAEMLGEVSEKDSRIAVAEELKNLGKVAQTYNLLDDAKRIYLNSSETYSKVGDKKLQVDALVNLATVYEKQGLMDKSKEIGIQIRKIMVK